MVWAIPLFRHQNRNKLLVPRTPRSLGGCLGCQSCHRRFSQSYHCLFVPSSSVDIRKLIWHFIKAVRVATWIKDHRSSEEFEATFAALAAGYWSKGFDISTFDGIVQALHGIFPEGEIKEILQKAVSPENKKRVVELTMGSKAFGAPWISAVNGNGETREYFGNDRWDHVFEHLGVPYTPVSIIPPQQAKSKL